MRCQAQQGDGPGAFTPELKTAVDRLVGENKIVLFMKGTKMFPQCGFSNTCVQIFNQLGAPFEDVNVLEDERGVCKLCDFGTALELLTEAMQHCAAHRFVRVYHDTPR